MGFPRSGEIATLLVALLLLFAAIAFGMGISLPIVRFEKLYFFEETPSLIELVSGLWNQGSIALALAVFAFSILFPVAKLSITFLAAFAPHMGETRFHKWAPALAKWSMMDVLLVALFIFAAKSSGLAQAFTQAGLWFYTASAIAGAVAASLIKPQDGRQLPGS